MWATLSGLFVSSIHSTFSTFYDVVGFLVGAGFPYPPKHIISWFAHLCVHGRTLTPSPTCMDARCQCSSDIRVKSCSKWFLTSWQYFVLIGRFIFLVCHLTKLEIWLGVLLVLWFNFRILCMRVFLSFIFGVECINSTLSWSTSWTRWLKNASF
jgi:hypothetical protein